MTLTPEDEYSDLIHRIRTRIKRETVCLLDFKRQVNRYFLHGKVIFEKPCRVHLLLTAPRSAD